MDKRFNVYYAGQLLEGRDQQEVRANLARLFNADENTLDKLFSGKIQLLKRDCDEATAEKYRGAMERAGALPILRALSAEAARAEKPAAPPPAPSPPTAQHRPETAAEKIAALAAQEDDTRFVTTDEPPSSASDQGEEQPQAREREPAGDTEGLQVAPAGTDVLREEERQRPVSADIDTSGLSVDAGAERLSEEPPAAPAAPDTSHIDMADAGESIPNLPRHEAPLDPDTSGLGLSPEGTDYSDCAGEEAPPPELDLSGLDLAESGSDVLEEEYRKRDDAEAPSTDHLSLQD